MCKYKDSVNRIIVCGGVDFTDRTLCFRELNRLLAYYGKIEIVSGHARGADTLGEEYAKEHNIRLAVFPADWKRYGRVAGPIRNKQMLQYASEQSPVVIAFWNGTSPGTRNMIQLAEKAGAEVHIVRYDK